jgi:hypothetical protein
MLSWTQIQQNFSKPLKSKNNMRKFFVVSLILGVLTVKEANAQNQQEIVYGTVKYDGCTKRTKGAYWSTRPEAKMVFEGSYPPGVEVYILECDYFIRYIDGEHNNLDRNYIVLPKGSKVYSKNGKYYDPYCGNCIEFMRPVDRVKIVETTTVVEKPVYVPVHDTVYVKPDVPPVPQPTQPIQTTTYVEEKVVYVREERRCMPPPRPRIIPIPVRVPIFIPQGRMIQPRTGGYGVPGGYGNNGSVPGDPRTGGYGVRGGGYGG